MTFDQITQLLDRGMTPDQIMTVINTPAPDPDPAKAPDPAPEPSPAPAPEPSPAPAPEGPSMQDIMTAISGLTKTIQAAAVFSVQQPGAGEKTPDAFDIMKQLVNPVDKTTNK